MRPLHGEMFSFYNTLKQTTNPTNISVRIYNREHFFLSFCLIKMSVAGLCNIEASIATE